MSSGGLAVLREKGKKTCLVKLFFMAFLISYCPSQARQIEIALKGDPNDLELIIKTRIRELLVWQIDCKNFPNL